MKKVVIAIVIVLLSLAVIGASITSVYLFIQYNNSQDKINKLEKEIDDLKDKDTNTNFKDEKVDNEYVDEEDEFVEYENNKNESTYNRLKEINYSDLKAMLDSKESFILLASQTWCPHCQNYKPILNNALNDNKIDAYVIELDLLDEEDYYAAFDLLSIDGTPVTLFIDKGIEKVSNRIYGESNYDNVVSKLKSAGYIK